MATCFERHDVTVSLVTWNVMHWFEYKCNVCGALIPKGRECACGRRVDKLVETISSWMEAGVDIICLQEVSQHLLHKLHQLSAAQGYTVISSIYHQELMGVAMLLSSRFRIRTVQHFNLANSARALCDHKALYQRSFCFLAEWCMKSDCSVVFADGKRCPRVHDTDPFPAYTDIWTPRKAWRRWQFGKRWMYSCNFCGKCHRIAHYPGMCPNYENPIAEWEYYHRKLYKRNVWFLAEPCPEPECPIVFDCGHRCRYVHDTDSFSHYLDNDKSSLSFSTAVDEDDAANEFSVSIDSPASPLRPKWVYVCNFCNDFHDGALHPEKCPRYEELIVNSLTCYDNEFPITVVNDTLSNENITLSSFHMPAPKGSTSQHVQASRACLWGLFKSALTDAGRQHDSRGFLIGGDLNLAPEEYASVGLFERCWNLTFLKKDDYLGESKEFSTCFCGPSSLRPANVANAAPLDNVITNMTWVTSVDKTEYGEQCGAPSDHLPVSIECTYVRRDEIPVRSLKYSSCGYSDEDVMSLTLPLNYYSIWEVDFSRNFLTSVGLQALEISWDKCTDLETVKLFHNDLDDSSCTFVCTLLEQCRNIRSLHLSHNRFTEAGIYEIATAAQKFRDADQEPLWLRIEHNDVKDDHTLQIKMMEQFSVCPVTSSCTNRHCHSSCKIHLPLWI